jgi:hypothetical protein
MGIGVDLLSTSETLANTFDRHWTRLNRDRTPVNPETYTSGTCVAGMAHVTFGLGAFEAWTTYTFQAETQQTLGGEPWFCDIPS